MDKILELKKELELIETVDYSNCIRLDSLCEDIIKINKEGLDTSILIESLFRILENNSEYDFGMPGEIVHALETYYKKGLEQELLKSLDRKPTFYTVWMLNRILNGTSELKEQEHYLETLRKIHNMEIPVYLKKQVQHLIELHS